MLLSKYLLPILKEAPAEATIASHQLMLRSGMVRKLASGLYTWLPLGLRVLQKIQGIIRYEMDKVGAVEVLLPMLQPSSLWEKSGRYRWGTNMMSETLKTVDRRDVEMFFAPTAEEVITHVFSETVVSYKSLPKNLYQISTKFRDEIRPSGGVLRSREFCMKDAYSFHLNETDGMLTYDTMLKTYLRIFKKLGLITIPVVANSGDIGGNYSHEFHVPSEVGESKIYFEHHIIDALQSDGFDLHTLRKFYAVEGDSQDIAKCPASQDLISSNGIEVGQIFYLGDKYSRAMDVKVQANDGKLVHPVMGCYGIGISRTIAAYIEVNHDKHGTIWHHSIAPFSCILINLNADNELCNSIADSVYTKLTEARIDVLYDDTHTSAGVKLASADLIGVPLQIIVGPRGATNNTVELKDRKSNNIVGECSVDEIVTAYESYLMTYAKRMTP